MGFNGDLKSSYHNGSNVVTVVSTNLTSLDTGINVYGNEIYCAIGIQLVRFQISSKPTSTVIHSEVYALGIDGILLYPNTRKYIIILRT